MSEFELTDGEIILRPFKLDYAEAHLAGDDAKNVRWLSDGISTLETVREWITRNQKSWESGGPVFSLALFDARSGQQVGMVESNSNPAQITGLEAGEVNISYNIYPAARGKGYATKAVNLFLLFLKEKGYQTALIRVNPENAESLAVADRAGFTRFGETSSGPGEESLIVFKKELT